MRKVRVSGLMLTLLLIGMSMMALGTSSAKVILVMIDETDDYSIPNFDALRTLQRCLMKQDVAQVVDLKDAYWASTRHRSRLHVAASCKWDFERLIEYRDLASVDNDSAQLVIGLSDIQPNCYSRLVGLILSSGGELVNTVSMDGEIRAVVADMPHVTVSTFVSEVEIASLSRYIEPNMRFEVDLVPNDPDWSLQWGSSKIEVEYAWNTTIGDPSVLVAVIDTGIDWDHPDLAANYVPLGYDWVNNDADPMDDDGHGTHCAGIIAAVINNSIGMAGLAQVHIMAEKGLDMCGGGTEDDLANAIVHAVDQGADILSNSWGGNMESELIHEAMIYAYDHDVLVIAAAGNDATSVKHYPAAYDEVVAVTASDESDNPAGFTNFGDWVEVAAPGVDIYSTMPTYYVTMNYLGYSQNYDYVSGTSMACPHVAGVAALIWSQFPNMTRDWARAQLRYAADDLGYHGFDLYYGYGRVNARKAVEQVLPDHDILVLNLEAPREVNLGFKVTTTTTIVNLGASDEIDLTVQLLVNDSVVDSKIVNFLASAASTLVSCLWIPTKEGVYNVTSCVAPKLGENATENNALSAHVLVRMPKVFRVPEDHEEIRSAIAAAIEGDTVFVASGTYIVDAIFIDTKNLTLVGEDQSSTIIESELMYPVVTVTADNVEISDFTIRPRYVGWGIGLVVSNSKGVVINNTRILSFILGICLLGSANTILINNNMTDNKYNLNVYGDSLSDFTHKIDAANTVNGKPVYYWINEHDKQVPSDAGYVAAVNSSKILIKNCNLTDNGEGVLLVCTSNCTIKNVKASNNMYGIYLYESADNYVSHNILTNNDDGIRSYYSNDNIINLNIVSKNSYGVSLESSNDNIIDSNEVVNNGHGIYVQRSSHNFLRNNNITRNQRNFGIIGNGLSHFIHYIDTSNTINSKPIYYWLNEKDKEIPADAGYVAAVNSTNITVRGLSLTNNICGVLFAYTSGSLIENVSISSNDYGVYLAHSGDNKMSNCSVTSNDYGVYLARSSANTVAECFILKSDHYGIYLYESVDNCVSHNILIDNDDGIISYCSNDNIIDNNDVTNSLYGVYLWWSHSNTISGNNVTNTALSLSENIGLYYSDDNTIVDNTLTEALIGIYVTASHTNVIDNNTLSENTIGIYLCDRSQDNIVTGNIITGGTAPNGLIGIYLIETRGNTISENVVSDNQYEFFEGAGAGIFLHLCSYNNTVIQNTIRNNRYGITLVFSRDNTIYHNNLIENMKQAFSLYSINTWDDGYPSGGNYWNDYAGNDTRFGPYQNMTGSDGVGDASYVIDENNRDGYPLINPWQPAIPGDLNKDYRVDMEDIGIAARAFGSDLGHPRWNPIADVNQDQKIDIRDISLVARHFGETDP